MDFFSAYIRLRVHNSSSQSMHCHVYSENLVKYFFLSVIYTSNDEVARRDLWADLRVMNESMPPTPWLAVGDFNVVYQMAECSDYFQDMPIPFRVQDFQGCVRDIGFVDMAGSEPVFTWSNKRSEGLLAKKLESALINSY